MSTTNPFHYPNPISPEAFVGRRALLRDVSKSLIEDPGASYAIIAGRRLGKTSLLMSIAHHLNISKQTNDTHWQALPIFFDFQSRRFSSQENFYATILNEIRRRVDLLAPDKPETVFSEQILIDSEIRSLCQSSDISLYDFQQAVKQILTQLDKPGRRVRLVLLLDEVDRIISQGLLDSLGDGLRSLISSSDIKSRVRLVITGSRELFDVVTVGSPFLNILRKSHLTSFTKVEINDLASKTNKFTDDIVAAVWKQSGGHPLIAQYLFHHLWSKNKKGRTVKAVEKIALNFQHEHLDDIEGWALAAGKSGLNTYKILAATDGWFDENDIYKLISNQKTNINHDLLNLSCHGLIAHEDWQRYKYSGLVFKTWFDSSGAIFMDIVIPQISTKEENIKKSDGNLTMPNSNGRSNNNKPLGWPIAIISYTLSSLLITVVIALVISKMISPEQFIPFFVVLVLVIMTILVGVDKLTGEQFLKVVENLIDKIFHKP
jgi:hypothetical protein